jgi:hypothetical protein
MTTTSPTATDAQLRKIFALRDRAAHANTPAEEADTAMTLARKLCAKYGVDASILDKKPEQHVRPGVANGQQAPTRKYSCRFGCGAFVQHTIDELNACAAKAREAAGGNAYTKMRDPWADLFGTSRPKADYTQPRDYGQSKARATGSHAYCSHEATKAARARCRKDRGF